MTMTESTIGSLAPAEVPMDGPMERPGQERAPEQRVQVEQQAGSRARPGRRELSCLLPAPAATYVWNEAKR